MKRNFKLRALKNKRVRAIFRRLERMAVPTDEVIKELKRMHITREVRSLTYDVVVKNQQKKLISAVLQNQAFRSRAIELKMECWRASTALEAEIEDLRTYLILRYRQNMTEYKTVQDRRDAVNAILAKPILYVSELNNAIELADFLIDDMDKAGWALKNVVDTLVVTTSGARNI